MGYFSAKITVPDVQKKMKIEEKVLGRPLGPELQTEGVCKSQMGEFSTKLTILGFLDVCKKS